MKFNTRKYTALMVALILLMSSCGDDDPSPIDSTPFIQGAGKGNADKSAAIAVDASGNSYVTGAFATATKFGDIELTGPSNGSDNMFIVKYDTRGKALWAKAAGGAGAMDANSVDVDPSGNVYVTGNFSGTVTFGNKTLVSNGNYDIFLAKYSNAGDLLWLRQDGNERYEMATGVQVDASGNAYVTGRFSVVTKIGNIDLTGFGSYDIMLIKYNASGDLVWAKCVGGGSSSDEASAIALDASNNIYITGYVNENVSLGGVLLLGSGTTMFLTKYNSAGEFQWAKRATTTDNSYSRGLAITTDPSGNVYVGGYLTEHTTFGTVSTFPQYYAYGFLVKYSASGDASWVLNIPHDGYEMGLATDASNHVYVSSRFGTNASAFFGNNVSISSSYGQTDAYVAEFDTNGKAQWAKQAGGTDFDIATGVAVDRSGNIYSTGYFSSSELTTAEGNLDNAGSQDIYLWKIKP